LHAGKVLMLEAWRSGKLLFTEVIWIGDDETGGAAVARLFMRYMPVERAIDAAAEVLCNGSCDKVRLKRNIVEVLTSEKLEFPRVPLNAAVRLYTAVEKDTELLSCYFESQQKSDLQYGEVSVVSVPAACNYYSIWMGGGRQGFAVLCTANKPSRVPRKAAVEVSGMYLTPEPLYISYFDGGGAASCVDVGNKCLPTIGRFIGKMGLAVERSSVIVKLKIIETQKYEAYYVSTTPPVKLFILKAGGRTIGVASVQTRELLEKVRGVAQQSEELKDIIENALMYAGLRA